MFLRSTGSRWKHSLFYFTETAERSWKTSPSLVRYMAEMFPLLKKKADLSFLRTGKSAFFQSSFTSFTPRPV